MHDERGGGEDGRREWLYFVYVSAGNKKGNGRADLNKYLLLFGERAG